MSDAADFDASFLAGKRILVLEDEFLILLDIERIFETAQAEISGHSRVREALATIEAERFDVAVLDYRLNGQTSEPVAERLSQLGIPFVMLTGAPTQSVPQQYRGVPIVTKPFDGHALLTALAKAMGRG